MRPSVRQIAITAVLALIVAICIPVFVHRQDFDVALSRQIKDPSTENTLVLRAESRKTLGIAVRVQILAGCIAFLLLNGVWLAVLRLTGPGKPEATE